MRFTIISILLFLACRVCNGQSAASPSIKYAVRLTTILYKLGDQLIQVEICRYGTLKDILFINVHDDETTSVIATRKLLEARGGVLIRLKNDGKRLITFRLNGKRFSFDPNRIFSKEGINKTLIEHRRFSGKAATEIEKFATRLRQLFPKELSWIVALHNNKDEGFSINDYTSGNERERDAKAIHINTAKDADELFLTTSRALYDQLAMEDYNIVLQNYATAEKDGSLSLYCEKNGILYLNCETEHGRTSEFEEMITVAERYIRQRKRATARLYAFEVKDSSAYRPIAGTEIFFQDSVVGYIRNVHPIAVAGMLTGTLELVTSFSATTNTELLLITSYSTPRIEFRIKADTIESRSIAPAEKLSIIIRQ